MCPCLERVLIYILVHTDMYLITVSLTRCPQHTEGGGEREGVEEEENKEEGGEGGESGDEEEKKLTVAIWLIYPSSQNREFSGLRATGCA